MINVQDLVKNGQYIWTHQSVGMKTASTKGDRAKNNKQIQFTDLLMTFSYEFQNIGHFTGFAIEIVKTLLNLVQKNYPYDFLIMDQLSINSQNKVEICDPTSIQNISMHVTAPEMYVSTTEDYCPLLRQKKRLSYSLALILIEILSQRQLVRVPDGMPSTKSYSLYINRRNRLINFTKVIVCCSFAHEELQGVEDKGPLSHDQQMLTAHIISLSNILQQMLHQNPRQRITPEEALEQLQLLKQDFQIIDLRKTYLKASLQITQLTDKEPAQVTQITKGLVKTIEIENHKQVNFRQEDILVIKKNLYNPHQLKEGVLELNNFLQKLYNTDPNYKHFGYLQQFFMRFLQQEKVFVADHISSLMDHDVIDTEDYFQSQNVFSYFAKQGLFAKMDCDLCDV